MKKFLKENKCLSILAVIALIIIVLYIISVYFPQIFPNTDIWFELLFQLAIGYIINFIFYILQVYLPRRKMELSIFKHINRRLTKLYGYMDGLFNQLCSLYCPDVNVNCLTKENLSQILKSIKSYHYITVIDPAKTMFQEQRYTVKEWMIHNTKGVESEIDKLCAYTYGREIEKEDIDKLIQLRLDFSDANNGPHPETYELRKANLKSYFERHLNRDCYAAIVEQDGKAVSTGILGVYENPPSPSRPNGRFASIVSVWTYPEYRRQGYAGLVMEMLKLKARENDAAYIELSATPMGRPLYEKLGFKVRQSENVEMRYTFK